MGGTGGPKEGLMSEHGPSVPPRTSVRAAVAAGTLVEKMKATFLGLVVVSLVSCSSATPGPPVTLTELDAGRPVALAVGQELRVELRSNPSTGYSWTVAMDPTGPLTSLGEPEFQPFGGDVVGAGGVETFRWLALKESRVSLRFDYARPFEAGVPPVKVLVYDVHVE